MSRPLRIYYNIVFGGIGGLLAWLFVGSLPDLIQNRIFWEFITGAVAGAGIGALLGAVDGTLGKRVGRALLGMTYGAGLGLLGGILGIAIGEVLFLVTQGGILGRSIGWSVIGAIIGTSEGIAHRAPRKVSYGVIGGALGGLVGGALFETLTEIAVGMSSSSGAFDLQTIEKMQSLAAALGLVIVGACIGSLIAFVEDILVKAWFKVLRGKQEGRDFNIVKGEMTIGGGDNNDIPVYDGQVGRKFAVLRQRGDKVHIENAGGTAKLIRGQGSPAPVPITQAQPLQDGDRIQLGNTLLLFRQRK